MRPLLRVFPDPTSLDLAAATAIIESLSAARAAGRKPLALALSGGSTPRGLYELLATPAFAARIPWPELEVYWTDERCVPPEHPESNYGMARKALLSKVPVAGTNVHRIPGELGAEAAAREYETLLRKRGRGCDVVLLGAGEDGHTASLFPGSAALEERAAWAAAASSPKGPRVTMTLPYLNLGGEVLVLVRGASKAAVVSAVRGSEEAYPVQRLRPAKPVLWLADQEAAAGL